MMLMVIVVLVVLGLAFGSFVNALVWRIHEQARLRSKKKATAEQAKQLEQLSIVRGRSMCAHCHHTLAWYDLIPVLSWLSLRGKCRYCHQPIGDHPVTELLTPILFLVSYYYWPLSFHGQGLLEFIIWLGLVVGFIALAVYDLKWFLLPNRIMYPLVGLVIIEFIVRLAFFHGGWDLASGSIWGALIGGGIFYVLFQVSKGAWIGGGDVRLGGLVGFLVGGPLASCLLLFIASLGGTIISIPLLASGRAKRTTQVPFGPFLILASFIMVLFGASLIAWLRRHGILPQA